MTFDGDEDPQRELIRELAMRLLARREHSRVELCRKIGDRGHDDTLTREVLDELESERWLSDERFAEGFLRERSGRGQGPRRIGHELRRRGVDDAIVERVLDEAGVDWRAAARAARSKRFPGGAPEDRAQAAQQARFLERRGFTAEQVRAALKEEEQ